MAPAPRPSLDPRWPAEALEALGRLQGPQPLSRVAVRELAWSLADLCEEEDGTTAARLAELVGLLLDGPLQHPTSLLGVLCSAELELPDPEGRLASRLEELLGDEDIIVAMTAAQALAGCLPGGRALLRARLERRDLPHQEEQERLWTTFLQR